MIRSHFGLDQNPFSNDTIALLPQQQEVFDTLRVHCQQGGLCVVIGDPGTGKSVIKQALIQHDPKRLIVPVVNRTLHTYPNVLRILCQAFRRRRISDRAGRLRRTEFHLREASWRPPSASTTDALCCWFALRAKRSRRSSTTRISSTCATYADCVFSSRTSPRGETATQSKNHNLILVAQPGLLTSLALSTNEDLQSRVTYSARVAKLAPEAMRAFPKGKPVTTLNTELDKVGLPHATFAPEALALIIRASEGVLRRTRNLCRATLVECVRDRTLCSWFPRGNAFDLKQVNRVLMQPHCREPCDA